MGIKQVKKRRFLSSFRERLRRRRKRSYERRARTFSPTRSMRPTKRRKRKRTALALGVTAASVTATSNLALSADAISAQRMLSPGPQEAAYELFDPSERRDASSLTVSDNLIEAMVEEEGVRYDVYRDVAGYPTVGVGHLVLPQDRLRIGDTISHERALDLLEQDLGKAEQGVRALVGDLPINQYEFDALVDLVFNVGAGNVSRRESPRLNAAIDAGDYDRMADELNYTTAGNRVAKGLIYRSERRAQIFESGDYSDPREA
ncbi:lysozyme [Erythrobacter sp.]|nr:lysozyme [Erythrobacter sp.]